MNILLEYNKFAYIILQLSRAKLIIGSDSSNSLYNIRLELQESAVANRDITRLANLLLTMDTLMWIQVEITRR